MTFFTSPSKPPVARTRPIRRTVSAVAPMSEPDDFTATSKRERNLPDEQTNPPSSPITKRLRRTSTRGVTRTPEVDTRSARPSFPPVTTTSTLAGLQQQTVEDLSAAFDAAYDKQLKLVEKQTTALTDLHEKREATMQKVASLEAEVADSTKKLAAAETLAAAEKDLKRKVAGLSQLTKILNEPSIGDWDLGSAVDAQSAVIREAAAGIVKLRAEAAGDTTSVAETLEGTRGMLDNGILHLENLKVRISQAEKEVFDMQTKLEEFKDYGEVVKAGPRVTREEIRVVAVGGDEQLEGGGG